MDCLAILRHFTYHYISIRVRTPRSRYTETISTSQQDIGNQNYSRQNHQSALKYPACHYSY